MTKERLEELIKQRVTIYHIFFKEVDKVDLTNIKLLGDNEIAYLNDCFEQYVIANIESLYETRDKPEWICKMHAERTERFEPPMWEDIPNFGGFYRFIFSHNNHYASFNVNKERNHIGIAIDLVSTYEESATKENYEKACEMVRDLFKGGNENHRR